MDMASADSLEKSTIRYFSPGEGGRRKVWNLSDRLKSKESSQVKMMKDTTGVVSIMEPKRNLFYFMSSDTLKLIGSESPLEKRVYQQEKVSKVFPLEFGDSIVMPFRCEGIYCGDHLFREIGTTTVMVDATGTIIFADDRVVDDVKRVHTIDSYSICMAADSAALDTALHTQVIDEFYEWYLPESGYPIIESKISTTYLNMSVIGTTKLAYCNFPENLADLYVTPEDEDETDKEEISREEERQEPDKIHYNIEIHGKVIRLTYDLDADVSIMTLVANHMGMLCKSRQWTQSAGQGYSVEIDCNGVRPGIYILYINVNGKVYSEKVTL